MAALRIVLGLGNPGRRYAPTRHNAGFRVLDALARRARVQFVIPLTMGRRAWTAEASFGETRVVLAKPRTYMNRSGRAAAALCRAYEAGPEDFLVVCDDADLKLGRIRIRGAGRPGGHNGLRSLTDVFGSEEFSRVKLGVRGANRDEEDLADYVLSPFEPEEEPLVERIVDLGVEAVLGVLNEGLTAAMNRYNGLAVEAEGPVPGEPES